MHGSINSDIKQASGTPLAVHTPLSPLKRRESV